MTAPNPETTSGAIACAGFQGISSRPVVAPRTRRATLYPRALRDGRRADPIGPETPLTRIREIMARRLSLYQLVRHDPNRGRFDRFKTAEISILSSMSLLLDSNASFCLFPCFLFNVRPAIMPRAVLFEFPGRQSSRGDVFDINDHQFFTLRVEKMDQAHIRDSFRHQKSLVANESQHVLQVRAWSHLFVRRPYPRVYVKIHAADIRMRR